MLQTLEIQFKNNFLNAYGISVQLCNFTYLIQLPKVILNYFFDQKQTTDFAY